MPKNSESYSLLKSFVNLESLYTCSTVPVNDLSPVSKLSKLEILTISVENVDDLSPLYALENAEKIYLLNADSFVNEDFEELSDNLPNCKIDVYTQNGTYGYIDDGLYGKIPVYKNY
ncbi:MAG: hypothetical protein K2H23_00855 [Oscillospiraceae bacterium]|nr:hypothetical protein [Oscillospiraceae bacterium]